MSQTAQARAPSSVWKPSLRSDRAGPSAASSEASPRLRALRTGLVGRLARGDAQGGRVFESKVWARAEDCEGRTAEAVLKRWERVINGPRKPPFGQREHQSAASPGPGLQESALLATEGSANGGSQDRIRCFQESRL